MPKVGMEPIRRQALIDATILEIGEVGSLEVTVGRIARRAGVSSGLAHHYLGGKDQILLAAMRHILKIFGDSLILFFHKSRIQVTMLKALLYEAGEVMTRHAGLVNRIPHRCVLFADRCLAYCPMACDIS